MTTQDRIELVVVHPDVLQNIIDNHNRIGTTQTTRAIGVLLGTATNPRGTVWVTNSFAVPFEEEDINGPIDAWRIDENHIQSMFGMYKGLNDKEHVLGWYSTGPLLTSLSERDLHVHDNILRDYVPNPLLVVIDVPRVQCGCPLEAYYAKEVSSLRSSKEDLVRVNTIIDAVDLTDSSVLVTEMIPGDDNGLVDFIEDYYTRVKNSVRINVSGYDMSIDAVDLVGYLEKHFESCGLVEDINVPRDPVTNAIISSSTTVVLRGEGAAEKALTLNGSDVDGWRVSVTILPPELDEMSSEMTAREFALGYAAAENPY